MALARIITRSNAWSRELEFDLLARGYAVEIVSPDKIPDNIADLELRVDAGCRYSLTRLFLNLFILASSGVALLAFGNS